ncbi:MAG: hypothetical protein JWR16_3629 [Nevskia sp.]|nr:hypothetical protein [Nevskia sp.]
MRKLLIFNDTSRYQHYGCDLVMESVFRNLRNRKQAPLSVHWVGTAVETRFDKIIRRHPDAAAIIVNGEGVIHHDRKHAKGLASLARRAGANGLPAYLINAALFDNSAALYRDLAHYQAVYVRDGASLREARVHGIDAQLVPDLSFDSIAAFALPDRTRAGTLVTDSVHPALSAELAALARQTQSGWMPMRRRIAMPASWMRWFGAQRFVRRVAACEQVLTGRFHAVTTCIATRTPFLAMSSNTPKIEALLDDVFGQDERVVPSLAALRERLQQGATTFREVEMQAIAAYLTRGTASTRQMFDHVAHATASQQNVEPSA